MIEKYCTIGYHADGRICYATKYDPQKKLYVSYRFYSNGNLEFKVHRTKDHYLQEISEFFHMSGYRMKILHYKKGEQNGVQIHF